MKNLKLFLGTYGVVLLFVGSAFGESFTVTCEGDNLWGGSENLEIALTPTSSPYYLEAKTSTADGGSFSGVGLVSRNQKSFAITFPIQEDSVNGYAQILLETNEEKKDMPAMVLKYLPGVVERTSPAYCAILSK